MRRPGVRTNKASAALSAAPLWLLLLTLLGATVAWAQPPEVVEPITKPAEVTARAASDLQLESSLQQQLSALEELAAVRVQVRSGVVSLHGTVLGEADRELALALAAQGDGVVTVIDHLRAEVALGERLRPALQTGLDKTRALLSYLPLLLVCVVLVLLFAWVGRRVARLDLPLRHLTPNPFLRELMRQAVQGAFLLVGVLLALEILDATALVGAVLGTAGVVGLAVGFAFRDLVENYIASLLLSLRQPFAPNDHVVIDGHEGKVIRLTSRATVLMTLDGNHLRVPNAQVFKSVILNYSRNPLRRFHFQVGVGTEEDLVQAQALGVSTLQQVEGVLDTPGPAAVISELASSSVTLTFTGWVDQHQHSLGSVRGEGIRRVKLALGAAGMDLPEPTYRVQLSGTETEWTSGEPAGPPSLPAAASGSPPPGQASPTGADSHSASANRGASAALDAQIEQDRQTGGEDLLDTQAQLE